MSKLKLIKGRLRYQILKILIISFLASTAFLILGLLVINYWVIGNEHTASEQLLRRLHAFASETSVEITEEIDNINQIQYWDGWDDVSSSWQIEVYDSKNKLVFARGTSKLRFNSVISVSKPLEINGAQLVVIAGTSHRRALFQGMSLLLSIGVFFVVFTLQFRKIEKYTYSIADGISIFAGGELDYKIPVNGRNELSMLASNINKMADSLKLQREKKLKSDIARSDLITNLAHDIRTPITVLEGYLSMLISDKDMTVEKRNEYMNIALTKCRELSDRASNIFEFVQLSSESEKLKPVSVNARSFITQRFEEMAMVLAGESFECSVDVCISNNQTFIIDKEKVQRIFDNLLSNILKYADNTEPIKMSASIRSSHIVVNVTNKMNQQIAMEPEQLFERMVSGDKSRKNKSAGLGLSICKVIMNMHGGDIKADIIGNKITFTLKFLKNV